MLYLAAFREAEARRDPGRASAIDELIREGARVELRGLSEGEVGELIEAGGLLAPARPLVRRVHRLTGGNPFFVTEVVRSGTALPASAVQADAHLALPVGVVDAIARRLDPLPEPTRKVLSVAAVAGSRIDTATLARLASVSRSECGLRLEPAFREGLLVDDERGRAFSHDLVREVVYGREDATTRGELHRRCAELLESRGGEDSDAAASVAHHLCRAASLGAADPSEAIDWSLRAATAAEAVLAYEEAASLHARALELLSPDAPPGERAEMLLRIGENRLRAGDTADARRAYERAAADARAAGDSRLMAEAALGMGSGGLSWADGAPDEPLIAVLEEALGSPALDDPRLRALLLARLADALIYVPEDRRRRDRLSTEALSLAEAGGDVEAEARALSARQFAILRPDTLDERLALSERMLMLADGDGAGNGPVRFEAHMWRVTNLLERGELAGADAMIDRFRQLANRLRQPHELWVAELWRAMRLLLAGRVAAAERSAHEALEQAQGTVPLAGQMFGIQLAGVRREQGRLGELLPMLRGLVEEYPLVSWRTALAAACVEGGRPAEARAEFELLAGDADFGVPRSHEWTVSIPLVAETCARLGDAERAQRLYRMILPHAQQICVVIMGAYCGSSASRQLGLLAATMERWEAAERHFEDALRIQGRMPAPLWLAHTRCDLAEMLLRRRARGDPARARELLAEAATAAAELDLDAIGARAEGLMEDAGSGSSTAVGGTGRVLFVREGEHWAIGDAARPALLRHTKGLAYIAELLRRPRVDLLAADLAGTIDLAQPRLDEPSLESGGTSGTGPAVDASARQSYRTRIAELREEAATASSLGDPERVALAEEELSSVARELASAVGLGGRDRHGPSISERARTSVTKAIRAAIKRIDREDPRLAAHLDLTVSTGTYCSYVPDPHAAIEWQLQRREA